MIAEAIEIPISLHIGITLTLLISMVTFIVSFSYRFGKLNLKVETLWNFLIRRALLEGTKSGFLLKNSPITMTKEAYNWYSPLEQELKQFYKEVGNKLPDSELFKEIEKNFGKQLLEEICIPRKINQGSCVIGAMLVAKGEGGTVDLD